MKVQTSMVQQNVEILIAEDSPTQALQLQYLLEEHGYTVTVTRNGAEALAAARLRKPVMLISDVMMPEMNGYQLCKAIKTDDGLKTILVILVTTLSTPQDVISGLECGADSFIRKPYDEKYLLSRIDYLRANMALREKERARAGLELYLDGQVHFITSERQQILDLLISTYEEAIGLNDGLRRSNQVLAGLHRIAEALNRANSRDEMCQTVLTRALELPGVTRGWIILKEGESNTRLAAARGFSAGQPLPEILETLCECRQKLAGGRLEQNAAVVECELLPGQPDTLKHASIPLWSNQQVMGLMNLAGSEGWDLSQDDRRAFESIGNQIGIALERLELREHLEHMVEVRTAALTAENAERQRVEGQLRQTMVKLEWNNRELQDFAYVASHDLQEPLRKIRAFGDRLVTQTSGRLDDKSQDYLNRMQSAAARMQTLITDLLAFSRVTTQAGPLQPVALNEVVSGVLSDLQIRIEETGGRVDVGPLPTVKADPVQMRQMFQNLISNALKFHRPNVPPVVSVSGEVAGDRCIIKVADNGIGFDEKYLDRIFTIFQRLHGRSEYEGTGIGLSVVRKIVERHGGTVTATSTIDEGSTFIVELPVK